MKPVTSIATHARVAGALYVVLFILGPFVFLFGKAAALVPGDPAVSATNVIAMGVGFRVGLLIETAIVFVEILLAAILYVMFRPVHQALAMAAAFARHGVLLVVAGSGYLAQSCGTILWPSAKPLLNALVVAMALPGELAFTLRLLIKGIDADAWQSR